ncbi:MAG: hypothetical protein KC416_17385, partial [Myxococcales bacterium]|nr:hypothetical protein [Myxococcales bacterium]
PVFSSGASLGMLGAELTADTLSEALASNTEDNPNLMDPVKDKMHHAYRAFGSLIHRFYNTRIVNNILFHQNPDPNIRAGLISVLAGDVWRDDNPFMDLILGGRQRWGDEYLGPSPSSGG